MGGWGTDLHPALKFSITLSRSPSVLTIPQFTHPSYVCYSFKPLFITVHLSLSSVLCKLHKFSLSVYLTRPSKVCVFGLIGPERPNGL